jgi:hypothetical protein
MNNKASWEEIWTVEVNNEITLGASGEAAECALNDAQSAAEAVRSFALPADSLKTATPRSSM